MEKKLGMVCAHLRRLGKDFVEPEGITEVRPYLDELTKILPKHHKVTAIRISCAGYNEKPINCIEWEAETYCGIRTFWTEYVGDYMYEVNGVLEDGTLYNALYDSHNWPDYHGKEDQIGDDLCENFIKHFDEENQYNHSSFYHDRTERIAERCSEEFLLNERTELLRRRAYLEDLVNKMKTKEMTYRMIERIEEKLQENKIVLKQKLRK